MRLSPTAAWMPLTATETFGVSTAAFVWVASGSLHRIPVTAVDAYVGGRGSLDVRGWGWLRLAAAAGADADVGEAQRLLAELPWSPATVLHCRDLRWAPVPGDAAAVVAGVAVAVVSAAAVEGRHTPVAQKEYHA
ncbi:hypothetical protein I4F81_006703 [Pyropia yezoensis]|uniref:Uncharacterized protein n=1 Tax=Pyropia yezoensis TaxID=2788 RepID=A0ACC3C2Z8_PYRYE|nr:hypothetical protein I4F81_006703 [Neopyropia yezoensis]